MPALLITAKPRYGLASSVSETARLVEVAHAESPTVAQTSAAICIACARGTVDVLAGASAVVAHVVDRADAAVVARCGVAGMLNTAVRVADVIGAVVAIIDRRELARSGVAAVIGRVVVGHIVAARLTGHARVIRTGIAVVAIGICYAKATVVRTSRVRSWSVANTALLPQIRTAFILR